MELESLPRSGSHAENPGCYGLVLRVSEAAIDPGELLEIEVFFSGYGSIETSKLAFYPSWDLVDAEKSYVLCDLEDTKGKLTFGGKKQQIGPIGNTIIFDGGFKRSDWQRPTLYFDMPGQSGFGRLLITETKQIYAPVHLHLATSRKARPGNHSIQFLFTYFNGSTWETSSEVAQFAVRNFYQRHETAVWLIGAAASTVAVLVGIKELISWVKVLLSSVPDISL